MHEETGRRNGTTCTITQWKVCLYIGLHVPGHICWCICTCVRLYVGGVVCHPVFLRRGLSLTLKLTVGLGWLSWPASLRNLTVSSCSVSGLQEQASTAGFFTRVFTQAQTQAFISYPASSLWNEPFPQPEFHGSSGIKMEKGAWPRGQDFSLSKIFSGLLSVRLRPSVQNQGQYHDTSQLISYLSLD